MNRNNNEIKVGIAVLLAVCVVVVLVLLFGRRSFPSMGEEYEVFVKFDKASGVTKDSPVLRSGIKIGRVKSVDLRNEPDRRYAEVVLLIKKDIPIYSDDECRIILNSLLSGDSNLEILKSRNYDGPKPPAVVPPGQEIPGVNPLDMMQTIASLEGEVTGAVKNISNAAEKMSGFIDSVNFALGDIEEVKEKKVRFQTLLEQSEKTMKIIHQLGTSVDDLLNDQDLNQGLRQIAKELPDTMGKVRDSLYNIDVFTSEAKTTMNSMTGALNKVQDNLDNLEGFTEALGENGPEIVQSVSLASKRLGGMFNDISNLMENMKNADGTIARLMRDPELYEEIHSTITNVEEITRILQPVVHDFRIFSDKISRDPSVLGVRGAIAPGSPLKGSTLGDLPARQLPRYGNGFSRTDSAAEIAPASYIGSSLISQPRASCSCATCSGINNEFGYEGEFEEFVNYDELRSSSWWNRLFSWNSTPPGPEMLPRKAVVDRALEAASLRHSRERRLEGAVMEHGNENVHGDCSCQEHGGFSQGNTIQTAENIFVQGQANAPIHTSTSEWEQLQTPASGSLLEGFERESGGSVTQINEPKAPNPIAPGIQKANPPYAGPQRTVTQPPRAPRIAPAPALGPQASPGFETLPTTVLEFAPIESGTPVAEPISDDSAYVYPSSERGYVIELESRVQPLPIAATARNTAEENRRSNLSFEVSREVAKEQQWTAANAPQAKFATRPLRSANPQPQEPKLTTPAKADEPEYGSYRRFR